jgi:6-phosphogluconate dehydrogenase
MRHGHKLVVFDRSAEAVEKYEKLGATSAADLAKLAGALETPRIFWIMVPAGDPVDETIAALLPNMSPGDIIIDGGNSNFHDTIRRGKQLAASKIELIDSGTQRRHLGTRERLLSDGRRSNAAVKHCEPITALAPENGYASAPPVPGTT